MTEALDIGCGRSKRPGCLGMDIVPLPGVDVVHDLRQIPWPFQENQFSEVYASHVLEHVPDLVGVMEEIHRILKPGGRLYVRVPYYRHPIAFHDPTHVRFFTEQTFSYFTEGGGAGRVFNYYTAARFHLEAQQIIAEGPSGFPRWHIARYGRPRELAKVILRYWPARPMEIRATLIALKEGPRSRTVEGPTGS